MSKTTSGTTKAGARTQRQQPICPNCGQFQHQGRNGYIDCVNDCAERKLAPRVFVEISAGAITEAEETRRGE